MKLVSAPPTFISVTTQPQVEDFQNENKKFGSGCEYATLRLKNSNRQSLNQPITKKCLAIGGHKRRITLSYQIGCRTAVIAMQPFPYGQI